MQLAFGPGAVWGIPSAANASPVRFALAKSSALAFSSQVKAARGANVFAKALGRGAIDVKATFECEALSLRQMSDLFLNGATSTGQEAVATDEVVTVGTSPYTGTVSNSATFTQDLGVKYQATGKYLTLVASVTATGQYSVTAGVYTFHTSDSGAKVLISYKYTLTTGNLVTLSNYMQGCPNPFKAVLARQFKTQQEVITLNSVLGDGYDESSGQDSFNSPKLTCQASTDDADVLGTISMAEAA